MVLLTDLIAFTDKYLSVACKDACPNGLQVEGRPVINKLVSGVSANMQLLEHAVSVKADAVLVHHGYFWRHDDPSVQGLLRKRLKCLLEHEISLIAYHLPLDYHHVVGNNTQLAKVMQWSIAGRMPSSCGIDVGMHGLLPSPLTVSELSEDLMVKLSHKPLVVANDSRKNIVKLAWCTGAAGDDIFQAFALGVDAYVTGEIAERNVHVAKELDIVLIAAGHHATERYGVQALGDVLAKEFSIDHQYVEITSPV